MWGGLAAMILLVAVACTGSIGNPPVLLGIRVEFLLFALTLAGVALFHEQTLPVALTGLAAVVLVKMATASGFSLPQHLLHECGILINLLGLLIGFAVLANHFEQSGAPELLPRYLPNGVAGAFALLVAVFVLSSFLDNIAAALIGGAAAKHLFHNRLHVGYLAAIVAASNAGGAGSVLGDTTTTMMWIDGVDFRDVLHAYAAAIPALLFCGYFAARQQHALQGIQKNPTRGASLQWSRLMGVLLVLAAAVAANVWLGFPAAGVWAGLLIAAAFTKTDWSVALGAVRGAIFLLSLVLAASLMPVEALPAASWPTALGLGFVSAVFDNIPLTKLALDQGGYDWGVLAYAVGYGGSMIWFGSSAGVAMSGLFPEAKSVGGWLKSGWHVTLAYVLGFAVLMLTVGWHPHPPHRATYSSATLNIEAPP